MLSTNSNEARGNAHCNEANYAYRYIYEFLSAVSPGYKVLREPSHGLVIAVLQCCVYPLNVGRQTYVAIATCLCHVQIVILQSDWLTQKQDSLLPTRAWSEHETISRGPRGATLEERTFVYNNDKLNKYNIIVTKIGMGIATKSN